MGALPWLFQFLLYFAQYHLAFSSSSSLSSFSSSPHPLCRHDQRSALLQFKHVFIIDMGASSECIDLSGIPSYPKTTSWNEGDATDCCSWDGVTCNRFTGHVIGLDLSCSQLYGTIPPNSSLSQLSHLQLLNLAHNHFNHSPIPYAFGSFPSLTHLNLSYSAFSVLKLSWNCLDGPIPHGSQFNTFENDSYAGNSGLCGFPLSKECEENQTTIQPPVLHQQEDDPYFDGYFWKIVVIGYGCGMTLGLFLGSLMFLIGRPKFFVRLAEKEVPKKVVRLRRMVTDTVGRIK